MSETWKPVVGFEGQYEVSDQGRVRSLRWTPARFLKPGIASHGYPTVALNHKSYPLGWLILLAFVGPRPKGFVCRHLDGNKLHNCLSNLEWSTHRRNQQDKKWHRSPNGRNQKLTPEIIIKIKQALTSANKTTEELGKDFNISGRTIRYIRAGERHADVE